MTTSAEVSLILRLTSLTFPEKWSYVNSKKSLKCWKLFRLLNEIFPIDTGFPPRQRSRSALTTPLTSHRLLPCEKNTPIDLLPRNRHINPRIPPKEIHRLQSNRHLLAGHNRPILDPGIMSRAESVPDYDVFPPYTRQLRLSTISSFLPPLRDRRSDPLPAHRLHRMLARREEIVVLILRDPHSVLRKLRSAGVERARVG